MSFRDGRPELAEADPRTSSGKCMGCLGHGQVNGTSCPDCDGFGLARPKADPGTPAGMPDLTPEEVRAMSEGAQTGTVTIPARLQCRGCAGTGRVNETRSCRWCFGRGWSDPAAVRGEP